MSHHPNPEAENNKKKKTKNGVKQIYIKELWKGKVIGKHMIWHA